MTTESAGLYIHIPFCKAKCHYCAFNSRPLGSREPDEYLEGLLTHLGMMAHDRWWQEQTFASLFIGGGTPTVFPVRTLRRLLQFCLQSFSFAQNAEISVEANPDTLSSPKLHSLLEAGFNRLSIGVQSFDDGVLSAIGRIHTAAQGIKAVTEARQAGFTNINVDLMFGLPGQTLSIHQTSVNTALSLGVTHLAVYELMLEEGARLPAMLEAKSLSLPGERTTVAMLQWTGQRLAAAGMLQYEISNFCLPGRHCIHNMNYWENGSYLGIGAGAVSNLAGLRLVNIENPETYCRALRSGRLPLSEGEALSNEASFRETVVMGLRMLDGIDLEKLARRFPTAFSPAYKQRIDRLVRTGLLCRDQKRLRLSRRGLLLANQALAELV